MSLQRNHQRKHRLKQQRGEFLMSRALALAVVLLAILAVALWIAKGRDNKRLAVQKAEEAQNSGGAPGMANASAASVAATTSEPRPIGFGLTFALLPSGDRAPVDIASLSCHGEPRALDQAHKDSCNPYKGDTSCRIVLPVLCLRPAGVTKPAGVEDGFYQGWTGGALAATQPVMGAILESLAAASARCVAELGPGYRMAEFHDGDGGWGLQGQRGGGFSQHNTRYWVHINDQRGNCWDSTP